MDVDQEGDESQQAQDDHGTEPENLEFADQQQYAAAPSGGWNHDGSEHRQSIKELTDKPETNFDIRADMLKLALRIVEATGGRQGRQKDPKKGRLWNLLERLLRTMEA
eukprot:2583020-Heterocapsa_arctica.AAC.1